MKYFIFPVSIFFSVLMCCAQAQTVDTLVDVGGYKLHFTITSGKGIPILFEAGGGDDGSAWKNILQPIAGITQTTLITYDRIGLGKSGLDANQHGIVNMINGLETALHVLGYWGNIILVAHSQGGIYAQVFAFRHPDLVKAVVMIDATTPCFYEPGRLAATQHSIDAVKDQWKNKQPGLYYQSADFSANINFTRNSPFPKNIPVTDFVSDYPPFSDTLEIQAWKRCHHEFASDAANRVGITAYGCGHYIFREDPPLVITALGKMYGSVISSMGNKKEAAEVLERLADYELLGINDLKKGDNESKHSENGLNSWGYELLKKGELEKALTVFKLNVLLNPSSWNVYDSYGEALLQKGDKPEAVKMYQKSVELNPANENGKQVLENIYNSDPQNYIAYKKELFVRGADTLRYRILYPEDYKKEKSYPLVVFLHGAGERGNDNEAQLDHGGALFLKDSLRKQFPAIVIFPQCPADSFWNRFRIRMDTAPALVWNHSLNISELTTPERLVKGLIDSLADNRIADMKRIYLGGLSLGGFGTYDLVIHFPNYFAAAFAICGQCNVKLFTQKAANVPVWIFHGALDNVIEPQPDRDLIKALQRIGAKNAKYTEYPNDYHNSWDHAFAEQGLLPWLFSFKK